MSFATDSPETLLSPVWSHLTPIVAERGEGACIYDMLASATRDERVSCLHFSTGCRGGRGVRLHPFRYG